MNNIDETIVKKIEGYGYPASYTKNCLKENKLNYATTTYYLLTNEY